MGTSTDGHARAAVCCISDGSQKNARRRPRCHLASGPTPGRGIVTPAARVDGQAGRPRPRLLIMTIYGLYARDEHNWLSIASLVRLMGHLGVESQAVRASVSRLKRRELLRGVHLAGTAGYVLSPASLEIFREGDARIFGRHRATVQDGWALVVFSVPEAERDRRHELRTTLSRLGFGTVASGVWVAPGHLAAAVTEVLARRNLSGYVDVFRADHLGYPDLVGKVRQWWDLDALSAEYARFLGCYRPLARRIASRAPTGRQAFREYVSMLIAWQRLPYLDPGLPLELLPAQWNGVTAGDLFAEINDRLREPALRHVESVIRG